MKSFRKLVSEVAQPKAGDEARFKAKHVVDPKTHPVAPDNVFTGGTVRSPKRRADREKGEDEEVYEGSFDVPTAEGGEHDSEDSHTKYKKGNKSSKTMKEAKKLDPVGKADADIDNDGDVDSSDKYLHARRRAISKAIKKEATDTQMGTITVTSDEERKKRAQMYRDKKAASMKKEEAELEEAKSWFMQSDHDDFAKMSPEERKDRHQRLLKLTKHSDSHIRSFAKSAANEFKAKYMNEEVEQIDEISKKTLGSYVAKASSAAASDAAKYGQQGSSEKGLAHFRKAYSRLHNIKKATDRLTKEEAELDEVLKPSTDMGTWIKDFEKSDAPQFKGKSQKKRREMAIAAKYAAEREAGMREEVEQLDELSPDTLHSYIKKSSADMKKHASMAGYDSRSRAYTNAAKNAKRASKRMQGITSASGRLADKANMAEDAWEEVPMMMSQLEFICYAAEEIMDYLDIGIDPEEWYQNKLANAYQTMMSLYSYARGEMRMSTNMYGEEVELDESITKMSHGRLKFHLNTSTPHGSYSNDEMKAERDRRLKTGEGEAYRKAKAGLSEVTQSAVKKTVTYTDAKGHSRTRNVPIKSVERDEYGQDKIRESIELEEVFNQGIVKLKDGGSVILKKEDADLLNQMFKDLSSTNRKKMQEIAMKDKNGFNEILSFAREAL